MATGIKEVARRAGVSIATVSRVLSHQPHVTEGVRQQVMAAVEELGYQPSRVARRLRRQESKILGLIISDIQNSFFTSLVRAVEDVASHNDYAVFLCNSDEDLQKEQMYIDLLLAEHVAGVVISPTCETDTYCVRLLENGIPVVTVDRRLLQVPCPGVLVDNEAAAAELVDHLVADGHRRIAGLFGLMTMTTGRQRYEGYTRGLRANGLPVLPELVRYSLPHEAAGYAFANELLSAPEPPSAILGGNNLLTMGALRAIRERGLRIPRDIAIVSFDVVPWMPLFEPPLTVIAMPTYDMGRIAAEILLRSIAGEDASEPAPAQDVILNATLQLGQSCHAHPPAGQPTPTGGHFPHDR
jgi:DNA-binding LacI/PurR family transcriptional regulator